MPSRIDDKTMVPLRVVAVLFSIGIGVTITGAFWVQGVNDHLKSIDDRFSRIETKLGIPEVSGLRAPAGYPIEARGAVYGPTFKTE